MIGWWLGRRVFPLPPLPTYALQPLGAALIMALSLWPCRAWIGPLALVLQISLGALTYALAPGLLELGAGGRLVRLLRSAGASPT